MKNNENKPMEKLMGKGRENIPTVAFHVMTFIMRCADTVANYSNRNFKRLHLQPGEVVLDYGCGPARYVENASRAVGENGKVYAADIHPIAVRKVKGKISNKNLTNVEPVLIKGYTCAISDQSIDVLYALDMFHMVEQPTQLLKEFARLVKPNGRIVIEDGHQARKETQWKIENSGVLKTVEENKYHVVCKVK
jgi:ubiquinone/menaquinone biosynthesis C-methylase UbiE